MIKAMKLWPAIPLIPHVWMKKRHKISLCKFACVNQDRLKWIQSGEHFTIIMLCLIWVITQER